MATSKVVVEGSTVSASQLKDLFRQIEDGSVNGVRLQAFLDHRNPFAAELNMIIGGSFVWQKIYKTLGMEAEFDELTKLFVESNSSFWDVYVLKGVTPNRVVKAFRDLGVDVYLYANDLDKDVPKNDRDPNNGSYRVRFQSTIEADPELKNKSAERLAEEQINGITLLERLLLELAYFLTTGKHLDVKNVTLCTGSRDSDGDVPRVDWDAGGRKLYVRWCIVSRSAPRLRSRAVVS